MHALGSRTSDYDYTLPDALIAQEPCEPRDASRLLVIDRAAGTIAHRRFTDIVDYFAAGDTLFVNATQVFRARLLCTRDSGAPAEVFLLRPLDGDTVWEAMVQPGSKVRPGRRVHVAPGFDVEILETTPRHTRVVRLEIDRTVHTTATAAIAHCGHVPLPPYITRSDTAGDAARYQTVYAHTPGSVAAPTAGLHFTPALLDRIAARGVERAEVLLHVGAGTFRPIQEDDPSQHLMHEEWCEVSEAAAQQHAATRARGGAVWAVGTTAVRTLESAVDDARVVHAGARDTDLFIRPPQQLRAVDRLITNFHQPRSTLLMLVASVTGYELMMHAYAEAVREQYRFLSYGDAMCVL